MLSRETGDYLTGKGDTLSVSSPLDMLPFPWPQCTAYQKLLCEGMTILTNSSLYKHNWQYTSTFEYSGLVQFALHLVDALLFVHYLAIILIELRHTNAQFYVKVLRSPDGESKGFAIGQMSVQRAASWILDKYYTEFPIYNPFLDRFNGTRNRKGIKVYDIDGNGNVSRYFSEIKKIL